MTLKLTEKPSDTPPSSSAVSLNTIWQRRKPWRIYCRTGHALQRFVYRALLPSLVQRKNCVEEEGNEYRPLTLVKRIQTQRYGAPWRSITGKTDICDMSTDKKNPTFFFIIYIYILYLIIYIYNSI